MIGCEIRTYMRLGLGYMTAVAAFPGFLLGYLPYTLNVDYWEDLARETTISKIKHVPDMFGHDPLVQALVGLAYGLLIAWLLYWSIKHGMRLTGFSYRDLMTHANDELTIKYFERYSKQYDDESGQEAATEKKRGVSGMREPLTEGV